MLEKGEKEGREERSEMREEGERGVMQREERGECEVREMLERG